MKVWLYFDKGNIGRLLVAMVFAIVLAFWSGVPVWFLIVFGAGYFFVKSLRVELNQKLPWLWTALLFCGSSLFTAYQVQYLLLDAQLRAKTSGTKMFLNILCCLAVYLVIQIFTNNPGLSCIIAHVSLLSLAGINYFVYLLRGNEFIFSDIRSIQTGLSVAGNYELVMDERTGGVILTAALYIAFVRKLHISFQKHVPMAAVSLAAAALCSIYIGNKSSGYATETWEQKGSYRNGYILNFVLSVRDSFVSAPEGYSRDAVAQLEEEYQDNTEATESGEHPTIIAIMSESYADLSVIGSFQTNIALTPFYDSLTENTLKGYALSSVYGAKTPNSEWEFLTGNSMAFLPEGSVVYQQYISDEPTSLVSNLKNDGYTCVAMHPYYETGWSRNIVYPDMGFDETYFIDDFDQTQILREYITDRELYEKIIARYESSASNEDLFIMSISMQNHGGYTEKYDNFEEEARVLGLDFPDVDQYVSLIHESDAALEYLITYFSQVEEPVEIVFFGDHQPSLSHSFYPYLNGKGLSNLTLEQLEDLYTVPFFIWTNYESEAGTEELTSINYLSTLALERAGLWLPAYNQFLSDMQEVIPALNARAYYSKAKGKFVHYEDASGEEAAWLQKYEILQYNNMFDKNKSSLFFPYY